MSGVPVLRWAASCFDSVVSPVVRRVGRHLARNEPKYLGLTIALAGPQENSDLLRARVHSALDLVAEYGRCECRWLQGGLNIILILQDSSRFDQVAVTFGGLLRLSPSTVWRLSAEELACRIVYQAVRLRYWRAGFDDARDFRRRITRRGSEHALAFARQLPTFPPDVMARYVEQVAKLKDKA